MIWLIFFFYDKTHVYSTVKTIGSRKFPVQPIKKAITVHRLLVWKIGMRGCKKRDVCNVRKKRMFF